YHHHPPTPAAATIRIATAHPPPPARPAALAGFGGPSPANTPHSGHTVLPPGTVAPQFVHFMVSALRFAVISPEGRDYLFVFEAIRNSWTRNRSAFLYLL